MPFNSNTAGEAGKKSKRGQNEITALAKAIYLKALVNQQQHVEKAMEDVRTEDPYKYLQLLEKFAQKLIPNQVDFTSDGNELTLLSNEELVGKLNKLIARFDQE